MITNILVGLSAVVKIVKGKCAEHCNVINFKSLPPQVKSHVHVSSLDT